MAAQSSGKIIGQQSPGGIHQQIAVCRFGTEADGIAKSAENGYAAGGKTLGGGQGILHRQFQYQVGTAHQRCFCTVHFIKNGRMTPLNKVAAHEANNTGFRAEGGPDGIKLLFVAQVERIVFANHPNGLQINPSFSKIFLNRS